ncbi:sugar ABC transporter substrate-binding protein [Micromonospora sagamiensis]|uniref:Carbohydrate ABC transporter substrate-binding protein, CUT1 family (TC 3.A.1.1.-) n=1 Tax=Micromonospora sagamiensis TaxID=47875 RepID=A0A562WBS7_9ACTN|nr:sugar ABC transporter substrate-binding protein [Micromonospora sagamiensis]TWJ27730.1 carbohydrate ABC transporter substrate-binding protein, CUT1 family (TC 3.A.1.1.-) [Micromonospora sagamiensis]BCL13384.1 ABC transporter substrate-binding protein [Micromonospora sagamiensis]
MNRWKRLAPVTAVVASAAMLIAGCGGSDEGESADNSKLTVWMMGEGSEAQTAFLDGVEAEFKKKHPGTDVVVQYIPWLEAPKKFQAALAGGEGPDITELGNTETQGWAAQEALADLSGRMDGWADGKDILPDLVKNAQLNGKQYGLPWYAGVRAMYYRTDWFAEAGVQPPTTWDQLVAAAKAVQAKKPGTYGIALPGNSELPFYSFLWSAGAEIATKQGDTWKSGYNTPEAQKAVKFWTDMVTVHKVAPPAAAGWNEIDARTQFATGKAAMAFGGSWQQGAIKKDNPEIEKVWGTFPIPGPDGKPAPAFAGGSDLAVWEDSERKDLAWDYLTVLLNKKNSKTFADSLGFFPVYQDLVTSGGYADDKVMAAFATTLQSTKLTPLTPKWVEVSRTKTVTQAMNSSVMKGQKTVEQATAEAAAEMESILNAK